MFKVNPKQSGMDPQTAKLNSKPEPLDKDGNAWTDDGSEGRARILKELGISRMNENVADDNPKLVAALAKIAASGAPTPVKTTVKAFSYDGTEWSFDLYTFTHFQDPKLQHIATESLLATMPDVVIAELQAAGIKAA